MFVFLAERIVDSAVLIHCRLQNIFPRIYGICHKHISYTVVYMILTARVDIFHTGCIIHKRRYGADKMTAWAGDIIADASLRARIGSGYQLVLANIVADVIIPLSAVVRQFMAPGAVFICSGIIEHRWPETEAALISNGFEILDHKSEEEWHCFVCR